MNLISYINLTGYVACSAIGALCNIFFLFALAWSPSMQATFGTSTILLAALAIVDLLTATIGAPSRACNLLSANSYGFGQQYWFTPGSFICIATPNTYYTLTHASQWILFDIVLCRTCAVYVPFFYKRYVRLPTVQIAMAMIACVISASPGILGWALNWYVVVPVERDAGACQPVPASNSTEAINKYNLYLSAETWSSLSPLPLGVALYLVTFTKLWWRLHKRRRQVRELNGSTALEPQKLSHLEKSLRKVRLLLIVHLANVLLVLPLQAAFGFGVKFTEWGAKVPALWAVLNVSYLSSIVVNSVVFVVASNDVRA